MREVIPENILKIQKNLQLYKKIQEIIKNIQKYWQNI